MLRAAIEPFEPPLPAALALNSRFATDGVSPREASESYLGAHTAEEDDLTLENRQRIFRNYLDQAYQEEDLEAPRDPGQWQDRGGHGA